MVTERSGSPFPRITRDAAVFHGVAMIRDTGVPVYHILALLAKNKEWKEIIAALPVKEEDIREALVYAMTVLQQPPLAQDVERTVDRLAPALDALAREDHTLR